MILRAAVSIATLLAAGAMALPSVASADLPRKPACSNVTAQQLKSTFGFSFSSRPSSTERETKTLHHLGCTYRSSEGNLSISYNRYSSSAAARAHFSAVKRSLIRQANNGISDGVTQLLPLVKLRGLGDLALRSTDGTVVEFVDGIDGVTIRNGFADVGPQEVRKMVVFAGYVDEHA